MKTVLLTGGLGFIGSHIAVNLIESDYKVIIADDLSNSKIETLDKIEKITGKSPIFYQVDVCERKLLEKTFSENRIDSVVHLAGYKSVAESTQEPIKYYRNNLISTLTVLEEMQKYKIAQFVFSSSATVYGSENPVPYKEDMKIGNCTNPYGHTKLISEEIARDVAKANPYISVMMLRYFNPVGAHSSGLIGEEPQGEPSNLMPYICKVASGEYEYLSVFGNDYPTKDGTGVRDYIHVEDLAEGHVKALEYLKNNPGSHIFNLGTGQGYSVLEILEAFEKANNVKISYRIEPRRPGDLSEFYADPSKANEVLDWRAERTVEDMCRDSWNYVLTNSKTDKF
ncbi:MAG TPA: UDP-glucose 4-epimerase GalE [Mogibacterium sp.]|nr:UDP-glucose 4-epimerase GalE [Mogibacterium sp.]